MRSRPAPVSMLGVGSGTSVAVGLRVELHEHEVPDLDVAVLAAVRRAAVGAVLGPEVAEDLRADGPHGPVSPICQKLSVAQPLDALGGHADDVAPDRLGLVVGRRGP